MEGHATGGNGPNMINIMLKTAKAALVVLCHALLACILVFAFWVVEKIITNPK